MIFWDNLLRYPRFFISSLIGLLLLIISPIFSLSKDIPNKGLVFFFFLAIISMIFYILIQMLNLT
jgi:hypothetical protein